MKKICLCLAIIIAIMAQVVVVSAAETPEEGLKAEFFVGLRDDVPYFEWEVMKDLTTGSAFADFDWTAVQSVGNTVVSSVNIKGAGETPDAYAWAATYQANGGTGDNGVITKLTGFIYSEAGGTFTPSCKYYDNGVVIIVGGKNVLEIWEQGNADEVAPNSNNGIWADSGNEGDRRTGTAFTLAAGAYVPFEAYYLEIGGGECLRVDVSTLDQRLQTWQEAGLKFFLTAPESENTEVTEETEETGGGATTPPASTEGGAQSTQGAGENNTKTGDVSVMIALITLGAATFGGLKLKKR